MRRCGSHLVGAHLRLVTMPIYEEKLICPLAIHFTQEHIKTHFQDGRLVEATIPEILAAPSGGADYDIILKAPFPNIEILRWHAPDCGDKEEQWYTLDNRRLYCLQRMAVEHWPKRVAAVVDILCADNGKVRRKYDSTTSGRSVTISPSVKVPALSRWDWRLRVDPEPDPTAAMAAYEAVNSDKAKPSVSELCDVPGPAFEALLRASTASFVSNLAALLAAKPEAEEPVAPSPTESTAASSDGSESREETPRKEVGKPKLLLQKAEDEAKAGQADGLEQQAVRLVQAQLCQPGRKGFVWIDNWHDHFQKQLGSLRTFLEGKPDLFVVKPGRGRSYRVEAVPPIHASETMWKKKTSQRSRAGPAPS